jgi:hypothetical protein
MSGEQTPRPRFIFSLTTSPTRINELRPTINSLLSQSYSASHIRINIPLKFGRTGEEYVIPDWLSSTPGIRIHRCELDYGPGTKLVPTILQPCEDATDDDWVVTVDDDIRYQPFLLEELAKVIVANGRKYTYGVSGCRITEYALNGKSALSLSAFYDNIAGNDIILEAYCAIAYQRKELFADKEHFKSYIDATLNASRECKFSDDVVFSNYSIMRGNKNYLVFGKVLCRPRFWAEGCVRDVGNKADALHEMKDWDSPEARYIRVFDFLREKGMLHLQILNLDASSGPFVVGAVEVARDAKAAPIPNSRKKKALLSLWNFANKVKTTIKPDEYNALHTIAGLYDKKDKCFDITFVNEKKGIACKVNLN